MKQGVWLKGLVAIFAISMIAQIAYFGYLVVVGRSFDLVVLIWVAIVVFVTLVGAGVIIAFRKRIWVHDPVADELRALRLSVSRQFSQARARAKIISRDPMDASWVLFLAVQQDNRATTMAELGYVEFGDPIYHKGLTITTWTSPTGIAYRIEVATGSELSFDLLSIVLNCLMKNRPSFAINGAFVEYEIASLMQTAASETGNLSNINRILNVAVDQFGVDVPVHIALVGLEHCPDIARAAILSEHIGDGRIFGGFLATDEQTLSTSIEQLFQDLIQSLSSLQFRVLQKQLSPDFCASLVAAPMQLALLKTQLIERMTVLSQPLPPRQQPLNLQSIAFIGSRENMAFVDPVSQVAGQRFFNAPAVLAQTDTALDSITTNNAGQLASAYHRERFLAQPNLRKLFQTRLAATILSVGLIACVAAYGVAMFENYRSYSIVNARMNAAFDQYYRDMGRVNTDGDFLVDRILMLHPIHSGLQDYEILNAQHYRPFLPRWSMQTTYERLYQEELIQGLQPTLVDFIEKETFAYNALADGVQLIRLASVAAQFYADQNRFAPELIDYFSNGLAEQGEVSGLFQDQLRAILSDLFETNQPPTERNEQLRTVVTATLSDLDKADLLYAALMRQSQFSERVDLRQEIGPRFSEVFERIDDPLIYLVPRGYTRDGFDTLFDDGGMPALVDMMKTYEQVIGDLDNATQNAILRRVAQNYNADYIAHWTAFLSALKLRQADGWRDAQVLMQSLTQAAENPIDRLVQTVQQHTDIKIYVDAQTGTGTSDANVPQQPVLAPASASAEAAVAHNIRAAFAQYIDAATALPEQRSQFDLFIGYARDVQAWLDQAANAPNGTGQFLFDQFQTSDSANPLAVFHTFVSRSELGIIRNFGSSITTMLDDRAMGYVYDYVDMQWQRHIMGPHGAALTMTFPFKADSDADFPLIEFTDVFAPEGKIARFEAAYLSRFRSQDGTFGPQASFLLQGRADLSDEAKRAFERFAQIRASLFSETNPSLEFSVRTGFMSNELSELTLSAGITLHQFRHGPLFWDVQTWPVTGVQSSDLTLRLFARSRAVVNETFSGPWSWFRLIAAGEGALNPSLGVSEVAFVHDQGTVRLQFQAPVRHSPFVPDFFTGVRIPETLFGHE